MMCSTLLDLIFRSWKQKIIAKIERGGMQDRILKRYWYWVASFRKRWISHLFLNPIQWDYFCIQDFASVEAYWTLKFLVLSKMTLKFDWKGAQRICEGMTWKKYPGFCIRRGILDIKIFSAIKNDSKSWLKRSPTDLWRDDVTKRFRKLTFDEIISNTAYLNF